MGPRESPGWFNLRDLTEPVRTNHGTKIPGLRLGQPRSHALLSALLTFRTHIHGLSNRDLRDLTAELPRPQPDHHHRESGHLRPAATPHPSPDRTDPSHPPIPGHRPRARHRDAPGPHPRATTTHRTGHPPRHPRLDPATSSSRRLPARPRPPHRTDWPRSLNPEADSEFRLRRTKPSRGTDRERGTLQAADGPTLVRDAGRPRAGCRLGRDRCDARDAQAKPPGSGTSARSNARLSSSRVSDLGHG